MRNIKVKNRLNGKYCKLKRNIVIFKWGGNKIFERQGHEKE